MACWRPEVVLSLLVVMVTGNALPRPGASAAPVPCCWSPKWEGIITQKLGVFDRISNYASIADIDNHMHVDYSLQKIAIDMTVRNGSMTTTLNLIEDFKKKVTYTIVDFQCFVTNLSEPLSDNCIPEDAVYLSENNYLGITSDTWFVNHFRDTNNVSTTRVTVSRDGCVPMTQVTLTLGNVSMLNILTMQNVTSGIVDPTVFDVPDFCPQSSSPQILPMKVKVLGAYHRFLHRVF